ncbi:putative Diguanylate cyclase [Pseudodesulfovibrio piezophilus C1TLV30]|uniref:diguanylate cyclase n=2 Tax=Pseudodesulfovibrio TaxID=2035811 RepID=M1WS94_PSEP2|nr:putative Diguanylate cyclase [Pseudodesulfovibrio piezophilus C1TLV30]
MVQASLVAVLIAIGLYSAIYQLDRRLIQNQWLESSRAHFKHIMLTRKWHAAHGNIYVEQSAGNGIQTPWKGETVTTLDGHVLTRSAPASMTGEISRLAHANDLFSYHMAGLKPLNAANAPDSFERTALLSFHNGALESTQKETRDGRTLFRYMAPLKATDDCLFCHAGQGIKIGDVLGGISLNLDISNQQKALHDNLLIFLALGGMTAALIIVIMNTMTLRLRRQLAQAERRISRLTVTDELTGLINRHAFFDRLREEVDRDARYGTNLSLIFIDIDNLSALNEIHGHPAGDTALTEVARLLSANIRTSDIIARYGGEEFAIILPSQGTEDAAIAAEKLRNVVEVNDLAMEGPRLNVTISAGVASVGELEPHNGSTKNILIQAAWYALKQAKESGKNTVKVYTPRTESTTL